MEGRYSSRERGLPDELDIAAPIGDERSTLIMYQRATIHGVDSLAQPAIDSISRRTRVVFDTDQTSSELSQSTVVPVPRGILINDEVLDLSDTGSHTLAEPVLRIEWDQPDSEFATTIEAESTGGTPLLSRGWPEDDFVELPDRLMEDSGVLGVTISHTNCQASGAIGIASSESCTTAAVKLATTVP